MGGVATSFPIDQDAVRDCESYEERPARSTSAGVSQLFVAVLSEKSADADWAGEWRNREPVGRRP